MAVLTCSISELLLSDLLQLQDLLQGLRDLGPTDAYILILPELEKKAKKKMTLIKRRKNFQCICFELLKVINTLKVKGKASRFSAVQTFDNLGAKQKGCLIHPHGQKV